jgi:hypothetical protein
VPGLDTGHFIVRTLLADRVISEQDVARASEQAKTGGGDVISALVSLGIVSPRKLAIAKAKICEYPFVDIAAFEIDVRNATLIPRSVAERLQVFPLFCVDGVASLAMLDPLNLQAIDQVRQVLRTDVDPVIVDAEQLRALIARAYSIAQTMGEDQGKTGQEEELTTGEEPIVAAVTQILVAAIDSSASDVHINPDETDVHLRYRIDGSLRQQQGPGRAAHPGIVQRLKVLSKLDLTQTRKPQDGKFRFKPDWEKVPYAKDGMMGPWQSMPTLPDHWAVTEAPDATYPLKLATSPSRSYLNSTFSETPGSQKREGGPSLMMHADDIERYGLAEGAEALVGSPRGETILTIRRFDGLKLGVVIAEGIHPNGAHKGGKGINALTDAAQVAPFGGAAFHDNKVWVRAV